MKTEGVALTALQQSVNNYLLNYNNSVHDTTKVTPSELLFKHKQCTKLDVATPTTTVPTQIEEMKTRIQIKKQQRANYANDRRRPSIGISFRVGDWVQQPPGPIRYIVSRCGPYTFMLNDGFKVNTRRLKLIKRSKTELYSYYDTTRATVSNTSSTTCATVWVLLMRFLHGSGKM